MPITSLPRMVLAHDEHFHVVWATAMNVEDVERWHQDVMGFLAKTTGARAVVTVLPEGAPPAAPAVRTAVGQSIDKISASGAYSGCIILGRGFQASLQRSVVAALGLLTNRNDRAMKVAQDGAGFLAKLPPELRAHADAFHALLASAEKAALPSGGASAGATA